MYLNHEVQPGETIASIASDFDIDADYIVWNNQDLANPDRLEVGQILVVPYVPGIVHSVRLGETLTEIARRFDADTQDILDFAANHLSDPNELRNDTQIFVPGGRIVPVARDSIRPGPDAQPQTGAWYWPAQGLLTSLFGPSHPLGIDLAMPPGTEVVATRAGLVRFVGGDPCCSYGFHIIIDHGDGWETTYGHLQSNFAVSTGDWVEQGTAIGYSGNSGFSTGPHLHFETRLYGDPQDPLLKLE